MSNIMSVKQARELAGLSQRALAELAGVKHSALADVEGGRVQRPSHEFVVRIVRALRKKGLAGIEAEQLFPVPDSDQVDTTAPSEVDAR